MFNAPQRAKRLYLRRDSAAVDEYLANVEKARVQAPADAMVNPAWHIHAGARAGNPRTPARRSRCC